MIFIVIGKDNNNGDEYVRAETFNTAPEAVELCERLNTPGQGYDNTTYRVETIDKGQRKIELNAAYAKYGEPSKGNMGLIYVVTDSLEVSHIRTEDFTVLELFPMKDSYITHSCHECGSLVNLPYQEKHVAWHNKLLP